MKTHIQSFNESIQQYGIILINGKPKGKNGEKMLYAAHVIGSSELRPGMVMMFLSGPFYRIVKTENGLSSFKISYKDEDSLKASLNLKSPGQISIVRNNNKTPYHWRTLKHTNISSALKEVERDLLGSDYIFESNDSVGDYDSFFRRVLLDTIDSLFNGQKYVIPLTWNNFSNALIEGIDEPNEHQQTSFEIEVDCLYVGRPELDDDFKRYNQPKRFKMYAVIDAEYQVSYRGEDSDAEIDDLSMDVDFVTIMIDELTDSFNFEEINEHLNGLIKGLDCEELYYGIASNNFNFQHLIKYD
jgi:hypothetical protein